MIDTYTHSIATRRPRSQAAEADACCTAPPGTDSVAQEVMQTVTGLRRAVYVALAGLFLLLGLAGAVLPGLPATPFFLLTSYLLVRSSPALHRKLLAWKLVGPILRDWDRYRGVRRGVKRRAVALVAVSVVGTLLLAPLSMSASVAVLLLAGCGIVVIARLPVVQ